MTPVCKRVQQPFFKGITSIQFDSKNLLLLRSIEKHAREYSETKHTKG